MTSEELAAIRTIMREETNTSEQRIRVLMREEVNAAVYASEQRLGGRLDRMDERFAQVDERFSQMDQRLNGMDERLHRTEVLQKQMAANLAQLGFVLDEATVKINELQMGQIKLENKLQENTDMLKRDMQKLTYVVYGFMDNITETVGGISRRLDTHINTPINQAHPNSAA